ncbi:acyl-CoA dehydrogenase family protein [Saccharomonospora sp. NPDC006951]
MRLVLDDEQRQLRSAVRDVIADHCPPSRVRAVIDERGWDQGLWRRLGELGVTGLAVPEGFGGEGAGQLERCVVLEELGRSLAPVPYLASACLAVDAVRALGDDELSADVLPRLASGELIGTVAMPPDTVVANDNGGTWTLEGKTDHVIAGDIAEFVLVYAGNAGWFAVTGSQRCAMLETLDPTRRLGRLEFAGTPATRIACPDPEAVLRAVTDSCAIALAAESVGGMSRVLETTVDYAKSRVQFGRAIGSYQAVKHACADMYSTYEQAVSVLRYAARAAAETPEAAALASVYIGPAYFEVAATGLQLHGGIGYTWEHDAHLYYKRAKTNELLLGPADRKIEALAAALGI